MKINLTEKDITLIIKAAEKSDIDFDNMLLAFKFLKIRDFLHSQEDKYKEVRDYGYDYNGMFFFSSKEMKELSSKEAKDLFHKYTIYKCYPDGTEAELESWNQIEDGFYYGIEKDDYIIEV